MDMLVCSQFFNSHITCLCMCIQDFASHLTLTRDKNISKMKFHSHIIKFVILCILKLFYLFDGKVICSNMGG